MCLIPTRLTLTWCLGRWGASSRASKFFLVCPPQGLRCKHAAEKVRMSSPLCDPPFSILLLCQALVCSVVSRYIQQYCTRAALPLSFLGLVFRALACSVVSRNSSIAHEPLRLCPLVISCHFCFFFDRRFRFCTRGFPICWPWTSTSERSRYITTPRNQPAPFFCGFIVWTLHAVVCVHVSRMQQAYSSGPDTTGVGFSPRGWCGCDVRIAWKQQECSAPDTTGAGFLGLTACFVLCCVPNEKLLLFNVPTPPVYPMGCLVHAWFFLLRLCVCATNMTVHAPGYAGNMQAGLCWWFEYRALPYCGLWPLSNVQSSPHIQSKLGMKNYHTWVE